MMKQVRLLQITYDFIHLKNILQKDWRGTLIFKYSKKTSTVYKDQQMFFLFYITLSLKMETLVRPL